MKLSVTPSLGSKRVLLIVLLIKRLQAETSEALSVTLNSNAVFPSGSSIPGGGFTRSTTGGSVSGETKNVLFTEEPLFL